MTNLAPMPRYTASQPPGTAARPAQARVTLTQPHAALVAVRAAPHANDQSGAAPDAPGPLRSLFTAGSFQQHHQPDSTILLHGDPAHAIYRIVSGTVRCCTISHDGKRQIFRFAKKDEYFGLSDMHSWHFTAEAVDHVIVQSVPRAVVEQGLATSIALRQELRAHICHQLECREKQLLSLVTSKAPDRLLQFLRDFAASRPGTGHVALPMCRRDIADHLGMSAETVSRAFGDLKAKGLIDMTCSEKYRIIAQDAPRQG